MDTFTPRILVADDDEEFTDLYVKYLQRAGFDALAENHSIRVIEQAYAFTPDVIILDLMMPKPDGFQLCRMMRADKKLRNIPIIIVTALNDLDSRLVAMGAGADDYLTKPFHIEELKLRIDNLLEKVR
jgi:DNA-binding response OmpR family regulator